MYNATIDERPTAGCSDIAGRRSYAPAILEQVLGAQAVPRLTTRPYSCSVKYPG
jgi:hypothetical protein